MFSNRSTSERWIIACTLCAKASVAKARASVRLARIRPLRPGMPVAPTKVRTSMGTMYP
jgi:hypothetical protein